MRTPSSLRLGAAFFAGVGLLSLPSLRGQTAASPAPEHTNRLIHEKSPYLLQHAHNPVDWYPWGEEAFATARRENKPIFLSVGYSTCHWCHVMERESFENPAIAKLMNDSFVSIKVDREERPDVDATYMTFIQATTGSGGWPMTVFLTPDLKPFTGGTYFPATDSDGQPGLKTILPKIATAWREHGPEIEKQADQTLAKLREFTTTPVSPSGKAAPGIVLLDASYQQLARRFDAEHGGFGDAPKFPQPVTLDLLARVHARHGADSPEGKHALEMDLSTLRHMAAGGIHDQLAGGFHRYSTDARWHVPHFEKMLYDQAQLAIAYLEAYQITGDEQFAATARDILAYVRRDLTDPATGGFLSAEDADSQPQPDSPERVEGAFYVWTQAEIDRLLGPGDAPLFDWYYGVERDGNVPAQSDARGELRGQNVLDATGRTPGDAAAQFKVSVEQVNASLARSRAKLLAARANRPRPRRDDKIITSWNGLAISAFARAYAVLGDPAYLDAATRAARVPPGQPVRPKDGPSHAVLPSGGQRDRRFRGRLRVSDPGVVRPLRSRLPARPSTLGGCITEDPGRSVLGCQGRRLLQHRRHRPEPPPAQQNRRRQRGAQRQLRVRAQPRPARTGPRKRRRHEARRQRPASLRRDAPARAARVAGNARGARFPARPDEANRHRRSARRRGHRRDAQGGAQTVPARQHRPARRRRGRPGFPRVARGLFQGPQAARRKSDRVCLPELRLPVTNQRSDRDAKAAGYRAGRPAIARALTETPASPVVGIRRADERFRRPKGAVGRLRSFVGPKLNPRWVRIAHCRQTRQVVAYFVGDRSAESARALRARIPPEYRCRATRGDFRLAYDEVFSPAHPSLHRRGRGSDLPRGALNNPLRQRLGRFVRWTLSFSKCERMHELALRLFVHQYNQQPVIQLPSTPPDDCR